MVEWRPPQPCLVCGAPATAPYRPGWCSYECALVSCWDELDDKRAERLLDGKGLADYRKERQAVADTLAKIGRLAPIVESYPFPCWNCGIWPVPAADDTYAPWCGWKCRLQAGTDYAPEVDNGR